MLDLSQLIAHWGYLAIVVVVILGNMGVPVPEETILVLAGYLVWDGKLRLPIVLVVGTLSAAVGDNLGYWIGREYGRPVIERYGHWVLVTPGRLESAQRMVTRYGPLAVFAARFLPGLRFLAGPVAGITGLHPVQFVVANLLGALLYVPAAVGVGYGIGYGLGPYITRLERVVGQVEHVVLLLAVSVTVGLLGRRLLRAVGRRQGS